MAKIVSFTDVWAPNLPFPNISGWKMGGAINKKLLDSADAFITMNVLNPSTLNQYKLPAYKAVLDTGKPILVLETPVFRQNLQVQRYKIPPFYRLGWNHFLACGNFNNENSPEDRWKMYQEIQGLKLEPWRDLNESGHILLVLQKEQDSSLISMKDRFGSQTNFIRAMVTNIRHYTDKDIVIRPHPLYAHRTEIPKDILARYNNVHVSNNLVSESTAHGGSGLAKDLDNSYCVIGYNSNTLIESVMKGIYTITMDSDAHSYEVSRNWIGDINKPQYKCNREQWVKNLSYCQWSVQEIMDGTAWEHLKGVYF